MNPKHIKYILCVLVMFSVGLVLGYYFDFFIQTPAKPTETKQLVTEGTPKELIFVTTYSCGHTTTYSDHQKIAFHDTQELLGAFPDWSVEDSDENQITLSKAVPTLCDQHYTAKLEGATVTVTQRSTEMTVKQFEIQGKSLSAEETALLTSGVEMNSKEELASFLEDYTS